MFNVFKDKDDLVKMVALLEEKIATLEEKNEKLEADNKYLRLQPRTSYVEVAKNFALPSDLDKEIWQRAIDDIQPILSDKILMSLKEMGRAIERERSMRKPYGMVAFDQASRVHEVQVVLPEVRTNIKFFGGY